MHPGGSWICCNTRHRHTDLGHTDFHLHDAGTQLGDRPVRVGSGLRGQGSGVRGQGSGLRAQGSGFSLPVITQRVPPEEVRAEMAPPSPPGWDPVL